MAIFAAWFDTLDEKIPGFWQNLALDEYGWKWLQEECRAEHQQVTELMGGDRRSILLSDGQEMRALKHLYILLKEKTRKLAQGLAATENQRADWDDYPGLAVKKYCRYCEILKKYPPYRDWVGEQYLETILRILREQQSPPPRKPGKLHLPASSSLLKSGLFRGREEDLAQIERIFAKQDIVVLTGLGGMGKTELAIAYASRQPDTSDVYFLSFHDSFRETIARAATEGLAEYTNQKLTTEEAFPIAWELLMDCAAEDLLILDNVDVSAQTLNTVIRELGKLPMRCLVTTRYEAPGAIPVGTLPRQELLKIFDDYSAPVSEEERLALIRAVEQHTLTVNLIAQTLQSGRVEARTILDGLKNQRFDDIPLPEVDAHYPGAEQQKRIYGHLRTVFRVTNMTAPAKAALTCAVLLPQGGMDANAFRSALDKEAADALFPLSRNGWLDWHSGTVSIHPVIRLVCKIELNPTDESCGPFLDRLWDQYDPNRYDQTQYRQLAELFTAASDTLEDGSGSLSNHAGILWSKLGDYHKALESMQKSLAIREKVLPGDHPNLAASYNNVGTTYGYLGNHKKALEYLLKALAIQEKALPEHHPDIALSCNNIAFTLAQLDHFSDAVPYIQRAVAIGEHSLPEGHPYLADYRQGKTILEFCAMLQERGIEFPNPFQ